MSADPASFRPGHSSSPAAPRLQPRPAPTWDTRVLEGENTHTHTHICRGHNPGRPAPLLSRTLPFRTKGAPPPFAPNPARARPDAYPSPTAAASPRNAGARALWGDGQRGGRAGSQGSSPPRTCGGAGPRPGGGAWGPQGQAGLERAGGTAPVWEKSLLE